MTGDGSARRRTSLLASFGVGLGAVAWGLLQLLQSTLPSFHLRGTPQLLITLSIGVVGVAIAARAAAKARREAADALDDALDGALACWPPRTAAQLSPYDLGAHPTGAEPAPDTPADGDPLPPYVARAADDGLARALAAPGLVLLYGPLRAGKTRTAYEAVRLACPDARVLVPEHADGLRAVLRHAARLPSVVGCPLVLWLDEVERFLPGLDLDALDRLATAENGMRTVATIGEDRLAALLAEDGPGDDGHDRHLARRLLARARAVRLASPTADERQELADAAASTGSLRALLAGGWWPAPLPPAPSAARRRSLDVLPLLLGGLAAGLVAATLIAGFGDGWTEAPPFEEQLASLHEQADECETLTISPDDPAAVARQPVLVAARREACLESDEVRLLRADHTRRLRELAVLRPPQDGPRLRFSCLTDQARDPCGARVERGVRILVGAYADGRTHQALPFALRPLGERLNLASLALDGADGADEADGEPAITLRFAGEPDDAGSSCEPQDSCVRGEGAQAWAVFSGSEERQAVIVAGHLAAGTADTPLRLRARARELLLDGEAPAVGRACWIFTRGQRVAVPVEVRSRATANGDLAAAWRRALAKPHSGIVC